MQLILLSEDNNFNNWFSRDEKYLLPQLFFHRIKLCNVFYVPGSFTTIKLFLRRTLLLLSHYSAVSGQFY